MQQNISSVPRASFALAAVLTLSGMALIGIPRALAQPSLHGTFTSIDFPGASFTAAVGINPRGDIVGRFIVGGAQHGFLISGGSTTTFDVPGSASTFPTGITPGGDIVGIYTSAGTHGFLLSAGNYTKIDYP